MTLMRTINAAIKRNSMVRRLALHYPKTIQFMHNRFDRSHFYGLPLTLLVVAFVFVLAMFAGLVEDVVTADPTVVLDHAMAQLVAAVRTPEIIRPFLWIAGLGDTIVVVPAVIAAGLILWLSRRQWLIPGLLVSSLGASVFSSLGKLTVHRPRPVAAVVLESSYSFPSGHASIAVAFYGFLSYLLIRSTEKRPMQLTLFIATGLLIALIGLSRIVLGVHYLSDVWAGYLVGTLWLLVAISLSEWLTEIGRLVWHQPIASRPNWIAMGLGGMAVAWYFVHVINEIQTMPVQQ